MPWKPHPKSGRKKAFPRCAKHGTTKAAAYTRGKTALLRTSSPLSPQDIEHSRRSTRTAGGALVLQGRRRYGRRRPKAGGPSVRQRAPPTGGSQGCSKAFLQAGHLGWAGSRRRQGAPHRAHGHGLHVEAGPAGAPPVSATRPVQRFTGAASTAPAGAALSLGTEKTHLTT